MPIKTLVNNLSVKFASNQFYQKVSFSFLFSGELLGTAYIPLQIFLDSSKLSSLPIFLVDIALGIMCLIFGVHFLREIRQTPPALEHPVTPTDTTVTDATRMQQISPPLYFFMTISGNLASISFIMILHYFPLSAVVYLWLFWIQFLLGMAGIALVGYFWRKVKSKPLPHP